MCLLVLETKMEGLNSRAEVWEQVTFCSWRYMGLPPAQASVCESILDCNIKIHQRYPSGPAEILEVITKTRADERAWSYDLLSSGKSCAELNRPPRLCSIDEKSRDIATCPRDIASPYIWLQLNFQAYF